MLSGERLLTKLVDAWNAHDATGVAAFYAPDYEGVDVGEATVQKGREGVRQSVQRYLLAFPDLHVMVEETVAEGDRVALAWTARGTHRGKLMNIPATCRNVTVRGTSFMTLKRGKIVRGLCVWDVAGLLRALRLLPELRNGQGASGPEIGVTGREG
jgi:hypothetical protein